MTDDALIPGKRQALKALKDFIVDTRLGLRLSQPELAQRCGIPEGTIAAIESRTRWSMPRQPTLEAIAKGLGVPYATLDRIIRGKPHEADHKTVGLSNLLQDAPEAFKRDLLEYSVWPDDMRRAVEAVMHTAIESLRTIRRP